MATAPVNIAPVLTPHTLGVLVDTLERDHDAEKALSLRRLQPFVNDLVNTCFLPLLTQTKKGTFASRFNKLSRDFEPFRLYLNIRIFSALQVQDFSAFYEQVLRDVLGPLIKTAHEMEMAPELLSAVIRDFVRILRVCRSVASAAPEGGELTLEQFRSLVEWFHAATRFDYGLTAIFLVLEKSLPAPAPKEKGALLFACKKSLIGLGHATSRISSHQSLQHSLQDLETPHIKITLGRRGVRVASPRLPVIKPGLSSSSRETEIGWLRRNKDLADRYTGQWIVLEKDELVANDVDYKKARDAATQRGIKRPFIIFVPPRESGGFMGI